MSNFFHDIPPFSPRKIVIHQPELSRPPLDLLAPELLPQYQQDIHLSKAGKLTSLGFYEFADCMIGPYGLIITADGKFAAAPDILGGDFFKDTITNRLTSGDPEDVLAKALGGRMDVIELDTQKPVVILNRPGAFVYGHWLIDVLPSLWFFISNARPHGYDPTNVVFLLPAGTGTWAMAILQLIFGLDERSIITYEEPRQLVKVRKALFPSLLRYNDYLSPILDEFTGVIIDRIASSRLHAALPERFYITRQHVRSFMQRSVKNSEEVEALATEKGLAIIDPAAMSWPDQIRLFSQAKIVVGPFGSGLHNTIFSPSSTVSLSLGSSTMNWLQSGISALRRQRMAYLLAAAEHVEGSERVLEYDISKLATAFDCLITASEM